MTNRLTAEQRRKQIVRKATELFSAHGFEKMTVRLLADSCNITEAALYKYFPSKEKIYTEALESLKEKIDLGGLSREVEKSDDIEEILFAVARHILKTFTGNRELYRLLLYSSLEGHSLAGRVYTLIRTPYINLLVGSIKRLQVQGVLQPVNPLITARCFIGMVMDCSLGLNLWKKMQKENFDPEIIIKNNIPIYTRGLRLLKTEVKNR
jgi:AcrR family transcriptional regulator